MILETVLLRHHHVAALILSHLDLPLPGGASGPSVDVNVDLVAGVRGGDPHVLASVVATDGGRHSAPGVADSQGVCVAVSNVGAMEVGAGSSGIGSICDWCIQLHRVKINPQLADIRVSLAEFISARI